jgi:hypothetical protein
MRIDSIRERLKDLRKKLERVTTTYELNKAIKELDDIIESLFYYDPWEDIDEHGYEFKKRCRRYCAQYCDCECEW